MRYLDDMQEEAAILERRLSEGLASPAAEIMRLNSCRSAISDGGMMGMPSGGLPANSAGQERFLCRLSSDQRPA